jgi:hypothetical protein
MNEKSRVPGMAENLMKESIPKIMVNIDNGVNENFNTDEFLDAMDTVLKGGFLPDNHKFGKHFKEAYTESDNFLKYLKKSKAIQINIAPNPIKNDYTRVDVNILLEKKEGVNFYFTFNPDGQYLSGSRGQKVSIKRKIDDGMSKL